MSNYIITDASGNQTNLSDFYNVYVTGSYAVNTNYKINGNDISTIYNKLGNRSWLYYPRPINYKYQGSDTSLNGRFEIKTVFSNTSAYLMTPILGSTFAVSGVLIKITASTTITFNVNVTGIKFVIAGGGGGGGGSGNNYSSQRNNAGGGGGAGEVLETTSTGIFSTITVVIGNGGTGGAKGLTNVSEGQPGGNGGTTTVTFGSITFGALGGGGGASAKGYSTTTSSSGGSGGGGGGYSNSGGYPGFAERYSGNTSLTSFVYPGGRGDLQSGDYASGGGGGGAAQAGFVGTSGGGGAGGAGHTTTTLVTPIILGGGGGGGGVEANLELGGPGGSGGGGSGGGQGGSPNYIFVQPSAGEANTGGGGGGGINNNGTGSVADNYSQNGATGGSGVCYLLITNNMIS